MFFPHSGRHCYFETVWHVVWSGLACVFSYIVAFCPLPFGFINKKRFAKSCLIAYADNEGTDQPAYSQNDIEDM